MALSNKELESIKIWKESDEDMGRDDAYFLMDIMAQAFIELHKDEPDTQKAREILGRAVNINLVD